MNCSWDGEKDGDGKDIEIGRKMKMEMGREMERGERWMEKGMETGGDGRNGDRYIRNEQYKE